MQTLVRTIALLQVAVASVVASEPAAPENFRRAAEGVFVGGLPQTESHWAWLSELGVRTVVGVDGLAPDATTAHRLDIAVVHAPMGYGAMERSTVLTLSRVARESQRPVYVYCHHGQHRGPAAAAIMCRSAELLDAAAAESLLIDSGTGTQYQGLWESVANFECPATNEELPPLVEASEVSPLQLAMSQLDRAWSEAQAAKETAERASALVVVRESLRESARAAEHSGREMDFEPALTTTEKMTHAATSARWNKSATLLETHCQSCHREHRD